MVRSARPRDLLPRGVARLFPHARLWSGRGELHLHPRRRQGQRPRDGARKDHPRRAPAGARHLAAVSPDEARREGRDRPLHAEGECMRTMRRTAALAATLLLAVPAAAWAHAEITPDVALSGKLQLFSLAVPTE